MTSRSKPPVSRFPIEMMNALIVGARSELRIPLSSKRDAVSLRQRLYMLRAAMKREQHYNSPLVERAEIKIRVNEDRTAVLCIMPANTEFVDALHAAGIEKSDDTAPQPNTSMPPPLPEVQDTDFMEILRRAKEQDDA